ncbi:recombination protein RecT [Actinoallomurus sp. CA-142502]|uniref:recombination protein RecT n=1 Tax=Actinoallomurus sp. CA-142502 TaxID=3239885 RepID=UPI003D934605
MGSNLAQRAAVQRQQNETAPAQQTLAQQIQSMHKAFQLAMPRGAEAGQLIRDALTCVRTTKNLAQCDPQSVLGGLMTCAQLGLRPGVGALGHAWLLPFWDKKANVDERGRPRGGYAAQLVIGYRGYAKLCYQSGQVLNITPRTVYTQDEYELVYGLAGDTLVHRPHLDGPRGEPRLYYAVARLKDGGYALTDPMTQADMEAHRDKYAMAKNKQGEVVGPWKTEFEAMAHKTMVRRIIKLLPMSTELAVALAVDEGVRLDVTPDMDASEVTRTIAGEVEAPDDNVSGEGAAPHDPDAEAAAQADAEAAGKSGEGSWPSVAEPGGEA